MYSYLSRWRHVGASLAWCGCVASALCGVADEGMWLFSAPPIERIRQRHGITLTQEWLDHVQRSSVRFSSGGSGAFVSGKGLVLTNHHVGADAIQKLSSARRDLLACGFVAQTPEDELPCLDLELNVLISIEDVTARVEAAVDPSMMAEEAFAARRSRLAVIEQESAAATGLRSDVVTLWQGGAYHLYRSKKYTDVRLVFAPELQIASFGGDADNFEFPRFNLDICLFRVYEDGQPAETPHHLTCSHRSVAAGDAVFVAGHPGHTDRGSTLAELTSLRDLRIPCDLRILNRLESTLGSYAIRGPEERRQAMQDLRGVENGRKARGGILAGLLDPQIMRRKRESELTLRQALEVEREHGESPFVRIEAAQRTIDAVLERHRYLEGGAGFNSDYFRNARTLLRVAAERQKASGERLREYRDSNLASLELQLFSEKPLHDALETVKLTDSLTALATTLGADDELVVTVLAGMSPKDRAAAAVAGCELGRRAGEPSRRDRRRELYTGGLAAVAASGDPMLGIARTVDAESQRLRRIVEAAEETKKQAHAEITRFCLARDGNAVPPDATFTLRLASGVVVGGTQGGVPYPAITTYAGLFARADEKRETPPFDLPPRWREARPRLQGEQAFLATGFNFASTADIIGGNSGSPVINAAGELVGVIFDGNIDSLVLDVVYDDTKARAVAVDAGGIVAAVREVYAARALLDELKAPRDTER
jgi:hypothetical protein